MSLSVSTMIFVSALGTYMDIPSVQPWFPQHDPPSHSALDHWFGDQISIGSQTRNWVMQIDKDFAGYPLVI